MSSKALLKELTFAIGHLCPTFPLELAKKAQEDLADLQSKSEPSEEEVSDLLIRVGKEEYPFRKAYQQMLAQETEQRRLTLVLDHLEPNVREKMEKIMHDGVTLEMLVKSSMFESEFTASEQYQIEDGILHAADHLQEEMPEKIANEQAAYDRLVKHWKEVQTSIEEKIEILRAMGRKETKWRSEIVDKVRMLEQGWSLVERDPELLEVEKEIEYWQGTLESED